MWPVDIITHVFEYLTLIEQCKISSTCRDFHDVYQRVLDSHIEACMTLLACNKQDGFLQVFAAIHERKKDGEGFLHSVSIMRPLLGRSWMCTTSMMESLRTSVFYHFISDIMSNMERKPTLRRWGAFGTRWVHL